MDRPGSSTGSDALVVTKTTTLDDVLAHFGVKGMHWGRRGANTPSPPTSEDAQRASTAKRIVKSGGTKALSTKELQDLVTRMNLEQQFARLQPPSKKSQAAKFVTDILVNVGKQQATSLLSDLASKAIKDALKK
jgi:hypothetical protein